MSSSSSSSPKKETKGKRVEDGSVKRSISIRFVRHAESRNNEIYREARRIYRGGTPDFDLDGWNSYVDEHRLADPGLSARGRDQARALADGYLVEHLANQASRPVKFVVSPMRRTLDTVLPALRGLEEEEEAKATAKNGDGERGQQQRVGGTKRCCEVIVNALFHESEGCHIREKPEPGMNQVEIADLLSQQASLSSDPTFVGFPAGDGDDDPRLRGWYANGTGSETRPESEHRAAKFYLWMCEFLDAELRSPAPEPPDEGEHDQQRRRRGELDERHDHDDQHPHHDVFDAGVTVPGEEHEVEHDWSAPRRRRRRTAVFVGHGDFMGLVLKRIVAGFGYAIEQEGISHRSAFVHFNTGITDLEYFGNGRFLVMSVNQTPHLNRLPPDEAHRLKTGGGLKDGWSYLVPNERHLLYEEVSVAFSDELEDHVKEQTEALKDLYLRKGSGKGVAADATAVAMTTTTVPRTESGGVGGATDTSAMKSIFLSRRRSSFDTLASRRHTEESFTFEELSVDKSALGVSERVGYEVTFVVRRGMQVVGCASFQEDSGLLTDIVVRPSARRTKVGTALVDAVKTHLKKTGKSNNAILVRPTCQESRDFFEAVGFHEIKDDAYTSDKSAEPSFGIMTCKL